MATEAHSTFQVRHFDPAQDFPALTDLINMIDATDQSGEATTEARQREQASWPGHDLAHDRWVLTHREHAHQLLGYGDSWKMPTTATADIYVGVHPAWRGQRFGSELLRRTLARAAEQGATGVVAYADAKNPAPHAFLLAHGFAVAGAYSALHAALPAQLAAPEWPAGYTLHLWHKTSDLAILVDVFNHSYGDRFGHKLTTETHIRRWLDAEAAANMLLLYDSQQQPVGVCRVRPASIRQGRDDQRIGSIDAPGVVPAHRQVDVYRSLVLAGMQHLRQHGHTEALLESWSDEEPVIAAYCILGFQRQRHFIAYRRDISPF